MAAMEMPNETYDWEAARARLNEQLERGYAPAWQPEPGEAIFGIVVSVTAAAPTAYGPAPVVELKLPGEEFVSVWLFPKVLRLAFERHRVAVGEAIMIRYEGKVAPDGGGNAYRSYSLEVDRPKQASPDWREIAERYDDVLDEDEQRDRRSRGEVDGSRLDSAQTDDIPF